MRELARHEEAIATANLRLAQEGDARRLGDPDAAVRADREPGIPLLAVPVHQGARIPHATDATRFAWPEGADSTNVGSHRPQVLTVLPRGEAA